MTNEELAAIKARHDSFDVLSPSWEDAQEAHADRAALLAEVERLRAVERLLREQTALLREAEQKAEADAAALRVIVADLLDFLERHSNRWDGVNGKHPAVIAEAARAALARTGGAS